MQTGYELEITSIQHHTEKPTVANITTIKQKTSYTIAFKEYLSEEVKVKKTQLSGALTADVKEVKKSKHIGVMENLGFNPYPKKCQK